MEKQGKLEAAQPLLKEAYVAAPPEYKDQIGNEMEQVLKQIEQSKVTETEQ